MTPGTEIGRYKVVEQIGAGGQGVAFRVLLPGRDEHEYGVLKLTAHTALTPERRERLRREITALSRLQHPNIVPLYDVAEDSGFGPYFVTRWVAAGTLEEAIQRFHGRPTPEGLRTLLRHLLSVCDAVEYAHARFTIVHRDLTPRNICVGAFGDAVVIDWGLATTGAESDPPRPEPGSGSEEVPDNRTREGTRLGTLPYAAPEVWESRPGVVSGSADVYSLGMILKTILEGLQGGPPGGGRRLWRAVERVWEHATREEPGDRYPSAAALAADLRAWLQDDPVSVAPEGMWGRVRRVIKRRPGAFAVSATLAVGLVGMTAWLVAERANRVRDRAIAEAREADIRAAEARYRSETGKFLAEGGDHRRAIDELEAALGVQHELVRQYGHPVHEDDLGLTLHRYGAALYNRALFATPRDDEKQGLFIQARERFGEAERVHGRLAEAELTSARYGHHHGQDLNSLGVICVALGDLAEENSPAAFALYREGLEYYRRAEQRYEHLAALEPENREFVRGLGTMKGNPGTPLRRLGRTVEALAAHEGARVTRERLHARESANVLFLADLAGTWHNIGLVRQDLADDALAESAVYGLLGRPGHPPAALSALAYRRELTAAAAAFAQSARLFRVALDRQPAVVEHRLRAGNGLEAVAVVNFDLGERGRAADALSDWGSLWPADPERLFGVACRAGEFAGRIPAEAADHTPVRDRFLSVALVQLQAAVKAGFRDEARLSQEPKLYTVRAREEFRLLIQSLRPEK